MSRMGHRRLTSGAAAIAVALALPAAAHAADYTVAPNNGPCMAPGDVACGSLTEAAAAAATGDVFNVAPAVYDAATFDEGAITINGQPGVTINGTMTFSGATGGVSKLSKVLVSQNTAAAPGIIVSGAAGLELSDAAVVSKDGHSVLISAGVPNKIVRSVIATAGAETGAVKVESADISTIEKGLTIESSLLTGGKAGLLVQTGGGGPVSLAGPVNVTLRHVTSAGSTNGLNLDASRAIVAIGGPAGNITATVIDSIITNGTAKANYPGLPILAPANTVTDTYTRTLREFDQNLVFANAAGRNFRLRSTATAAIDQGGFTAGESMKDLDGEDRPGPTTDLGADEYTNAAPVAKLAVKTAKPKSTQPVQFDASGSTDREAGFGGGIVQYRWSFGDGKTETTAGPAVSHTYASEGAPTVKLSVVDKQGAASAEATAQFRLVEGVPPGAVIAKPTRSQKVKLTTLTKAKKRKKRKLSFGGLVKDNKSGVAYVLISVEKLSAAKKATPKKKSTAKAAAATSAKCTWLHGKKGLIRKSCTKPVLLVARLDKKAGTWTYGLSTKIKQPSAGSYRISAYAVDGVGNFGNTAEAKNRVIRFSLVK